MKRILVKISLVTFLLMFFSMLISNRTALAVEKNNQQDLKVLVIEINPILESITNTELYPDNEGHPKVSEYFGQDTYKALEELKLDLEFASHGYLNIIFEHEYLNEFPRYKGYIKRNSKTCF